MPSADRLRELQEVVEQGSVTAAARRLRLPRSTLSRRLVALERELGVRLLQRTTRKMTLTPAGQELYRRARRIVAMTQGAWDAARSFDDVPRGPLRVAELNASGLAAPELYIEFARAFPEVQLEVIYTDRRVDLVAEGIDVALWFGPIDAPGLMVRRLWQSRNVVVASPAYLAARDRPASATDLERHACVVWIDYHRVPQTRWPRLDGAVVQVRSCFSSSDYNLVLEAVRQGFGIGFLSTDAIARELEEGSLVTLLEEEIGEDNFASLVFVEREFQPPQVRAFIDRAVVFYRAWITEAWGYVRPQA